MKIYTKTGDKGLTSLVGGKRVPKTHKRIEAYGTTDEVNSWIGLIADQNINPEYKEILYRIQNTLFQIGSHLASPSQEISGKYKQVDESDVNTLEEAIDKVNERVPALRTFVLPGGCTVSSYCQIARTVCRRAERTMLRLNENERYALDLIYINRLSDYLFVLARALVHDAHAEERYWNDGKS